MKPATMFGRSLGINCICRHHVEPRVELHVEKEESFPISLQYFDVVRRTNTTLDVLLESRADDYLNVDGDWDPSEEWTSFTHFTTLNEKSSDGDTWSGRRLTRIPATSRRDLSWPEIWSGLSKAAQRREKQQCAVGKRKLDNARKLRGINFIDPCSLGTRLGHSMVAVITVQNESSSQETERSLRKFLEPSAKPKVIYTDNSLDFGKSCEDFLSGNHRTSTSHRSETNVICERVVRRVKEGTSAV